MKKKLWLLFCILAIQLNIAYSQPIPNAYVLGEEDTNENIKCRVNHSSAIAAVKSALRYNRVELSPKLTPNDVSFYVALNNTEVFKESCSVGIVLQAYFYTTSKMPKTGKPMFARVLVCNNISSGYLDKIDLQERINSKLKNNVDECLATIERDLIK